MNVDFNGMNESLDTVEVTYTALIQQYLSLLCHDNASFVAERMVAYRPTQQSIYLLAMSYYRGGSPKKARSVLVQYRELWSTHIDSSTIRKKEEKKKKIAKKINKNKYKNNIENEDQKEANLEDNNNDETSSLDDNDQQEEEELSKNRLKNAMSFLLAKSCMDLQYYAEAEDVLLRESRARFIEHVQAEKADKSKKNLNKKTVFDKWVLNTSPCPVPNGAAGLNILGTVCRKTQRRKRAVEYYRMSLQLDPLMWTSYEALCEMGAAMKEENDPTNIFGVVPPALLNIPPDNSDSNNESKVDDNKGGQQQYNNNVTSNFSLSETLILPSVETNKESRNMHNRPSTSFALDASELQNPSQSQHHLSTPSSSFSVSSPSLNSSQIEQSSAARQTYFPETVGRNKVGAGRRSHMPATSLFNTGGKYSPPSTVAKEQHSTAISDSRHISGNLPSTALFNTPGLTPIQKNEGTISKSRISNFRSDALDRPGDMTMDSLAGIDAKSPNDSQIISRARHVAARLYYEPSPETTPPHIYTNPTIPGSHLKLSRGKQVRKRAGRLCGLSTPIFELKENDKSSKDESEISPKVEKRVLFRQSVETIHRKKENEDGAAGLSTLNEYSISSDGDENYSQSSRKIRKNVLDRAKEIDAMSKNSENDSASNLLVGENIDIQEDLGVQPILELFCTLGAAYRLLCSYHSKESIQIFQTLSFPQFNTGWVQHQVGKAYFEIADYKNAQRSLENMQSVEPHRMQGLEVLSTTLWHLKKEVELSHLAQRAVDFDRSSPEAWCVVGNCFSLQKEHETALTFFRRSLQLDPGFTYSHTLCGHEYVSNEDFEKAINCYRDAVRSDDRHYNAWYGLGAIYIRQEKYDLAEYHFKRALTLNSQSSVLYCHLGMVQHANGKPYEALNTLGLAFRLDPRNPQARFQRANIFMSMDRPLEALEELEKVRDAAPREASVHFTMGKVLKRLGRTELAMRCFLTALDLDPKDNNLIKAAMDRLDEPDVDDEVSTF